MGKGAGEIDGILQLAGGLLVGGYALYQMSRDEKKRGETEAVLSNKKQANINVVVKESQDDAASDSSSIVSATEARPSWMAAESYGSDDEEDAVQVKHQINNIPRQHESKHEVSSNASSSVYDSSEEEEEVTPSWMSKKQPQTNVDEMSKNLVRNLKVGTTQTLTSTDRAISHVAFAFSDTVFVYPGAGANGFGALASAQETSVRNLAGHHVVVQTMETRAGAGDAVVGALSNGSQGTVLASSASLKEMVPSLFELSHQRLPAVLHVGAFSVSSELAVQQDISEVMAVRDAGLTMLSSGNAQEAHDFAVLAHVLSTKTSTPLLHFFDGSRGATQLSKIRAASPAVLENIRHKMADNAQHVSPASLAGLEAASPRDMPHVAQVVQQTLKQLAPSFGKEYKIFEYNGSPHAEAVVVALGAQANVLEASLAGNERVGVLKVRLLKPWSAAHFLQALPAEVRRVCVVDSNKSNALFSEVAAAFHSETALASNRRMPLLIGASMPPSSNGFGPVAAHAIVSNLVSDSPEPNFEVSANAALSAVIKVDESSNKVKSIALFATKKLSEQLDAATHLVAEQLSARVGVNAQQFTAVDSYAGDNGVARSELRLAPADTVLPESYVAQDANVVLVEENLLTSVGVAAVSSLREGGTLVVLPSVHNPLAIQDDNGMTIQERIEAALESKAAATSSLDLSLEVRQGLARKGAQVVSINAADVLLRAPTAALEEADNKDLHVASLWIGLAASIYIAKGPAIFAQISVHIKNAVLSGQDGHTAQLANVVVNALGHIQGHVTHHNSMHNDIRSLGLGMRKRLAMSNTLVSQDDDNVSLASFGMMSPIPASSATLSAPSSAAAATAFVPRLQLAPVNYGVKASLSGTTGDQITKVNTKAALTKIFPEAYAASEALRPAEHDVHLVRLTKNKRLTPLDYSRNIFHLEFDISDTTLTYRIGDALGVFGHNDVDEVDHFIKEYGLNPAEIVAVPARGSMDKNKTEMVSVRNLLIQHLDILGRPSKKFYVDLAQFAHRGGSRYEYLKLMHTGTDDNEAFKLGTNEGVTYAELLLHYKSANPTIEEIIEIVPPVQARHYSIASSMKMNPRSVHLLVVAVDWQTPLGRTKYGQCTRYLSNLDPSKGKDIYVTVDVMPSVLRMPPSPKQPIIMAGLGTGLAPYRAFIQERKWQKEQGMEVGPVVLFFGARHRHEEWLYGDEWEAYEREGLVTHLGLAFSRDQKEKIYIQDRIKQKKDLLKDLLGKEKQGYAYLCGPTWPVPAIAQAFREAGLDADELKEEGRYLLEVY